MRQILLYLDLGCRPDRLYEARSWREEAELFSSYRGNEAATPCHHDDPGGTAPSGVLGEAGSPATVVSLPARGRPPEAAARRAGLEFSS
jgi:hypothetical protein